MIFSQNAPLNKIYEKKTLPLEPYLVMNGFSELQKYPKNSSAKKKKIPVQWMHVSFKYFFLKGL